ncbi:MAG: copper chaperone PCu(A)C [Paracoccaceae bacterium]
MKLLNSALTGLALLCATPVLAADTITVNDAYARFMPGAMAGAAFMVIENGGVEEDRLIDAASDVAKKVELHTHKAGSDGVMQMLHVPEGFAIPAGGNHTLQRGGDHVMFMGLNERPEAGGVVTVTLTFEKAGEVVVEIPVDNAR